MANKEIFEKREENEKDPFSRRLLNKIVLRPIFKCIFRVETIGKENILPKGHPAIICGNHVGSFDAASIIDAIDRHIFFLGKKELLKSRFGRFAVKNYGIIPVDRGHVGMKSFKEVDQKIEEGRLVGIYPEGTKRGLLKGRKLKSGAVAFALKHNIPIIPVGFKPDYMPFRKNYVHIGKPIYFSKMLKQGEEPNNKEVLERFTQILEDEIIKLLDEEDKIKYLEAIAKRNNILIENEKGRQNGKRKN